MGNNWSIQDDHGRIIHAALPDTARTLCGIATDADMVRDGYGLSEQTHKRIDCPLCIEVVRFCKTIKTPNLKSE
jgi:hypothetical protein